MSILCKTACPVKDYVGVCWLDNVVVVELAPIMLSVGSEKPADLNAYIENLSCFFFAS